MVLLLKKPFRFSSVSSNGPAFWVGAALLIVGLLMTPPLLTMLPETLEVCRAGCALSKCSSRRPSGVNHPRRAATKPTTTGTTTAVTISFLVHFPAIARGQSLSNRAATHLLR